MKILVDSLITNAINCAKRKGIEISLFMCKASDGNSYYCIWTDRRRYFSCKLIGVELMIHFIHKIIFGKDKTWLDECFTEYGYYNR